MHARALRLQLILLFLLTITSCAFFYYQDSFPDNMFAISSRTASDNAVLYHFYSLVALVGYFLGPWVFLPFLVFAVSYAFLYSRRRCAGDLLNCLPLAGSFLAWTFIARPSLLGGGIRHLMDAHATTAVLAPAAVLLPGAFLFGTFRGSFRDTALACWRAALRAPALARGVGAALAPGRLAARARAGRRRILSATRTGLLSRLRHEDGERPGPDGAKEAPAGPGPGKGAPAAPADAERRYREAVDRVRALRAPAARQAAPPEAYFQDIGERIEDKLREFQIEGAIAGVLKGPVVDTFELKLGSGVRVSRVRSIAEDLSMALMGVPIRIVYPMLGKETVGVEVPREPRETIHLGEALASGKHRESDLPLPVAMGKDAFGRILVADLASMPHMLVAGATGTGKSVFINTLLVSLLVKKSPSRMRLVLIDPKRLELSLYAGLPHLMLPIITDPKRASLALAWACEEMERRYAVLGEAQVRGIEGLSAKAGAGGDGGMPYLVIVIDEFADLILTKSGKEVERDVCRLAAKARAAGIHLVLATQRPSVDVITGLIKANFPTRVSFRVTSPIDSRTILSAQGAELLLGKGDMLYKHGIATMRAHASFVEEREIESLVRRLAEAGAGGGFDERAVDFLEGGDGEAGPAGADAAAPDGDDGDVYGKALEVVLETRIASASFLQRRLKIGYNRAARVLEEMEARGVVGPPDGSRRREVLHGEQGPG